MLGKPININHFHHFLFYNSDNGHFFFYNPKTRNCICARDCREMFAWEFKKDKTHVGFRSFNVDVERFHEFWEIIENKLNLAQKSTIYALENLDSAFVIELSPFWLENTTRKSLLTLLMRCGANYYHKNSTFYDALGNYYLSKQVSPAIKYFLQGYTQPTYKKLKGGFWTQFYGATGNSLSKLLIKPVKSYV